MASRAAFVYQDSLSIEDAFTYFKRLMRDAENRVAFSRALQKARKGLDVHMYVTDIDSLMIQYLNQGGVKGFRFTGFELKNMNPHSAIVGNRVKVNGKQYEGHRMFAMKAGIDFFYIVNLGREFLVWNVAHAHADFNWYGRGSAHDYYAFVSLDDVIRVPAQELPETLRFLLWGGEFMAVSLYRLHPQQTSIKDAMKAAELADLKGRIVLDPFAGTGTLVYAAAKAGAEFVIGSDIENWRNYLRPQLREVNNYILHWHVDAMDAVKYYSHEVLFTDPPNPARVVGSAPISLVRDFHVSGSELKRMFEGKFSERNLMGKKWVAVTYVVRLIRYELLQGHRVVVHAFKDSGRGFDWREILSRHFKLTRIYDDYFEVRGRG